MRKLLLVDVPAEPADFLQRVGRAVRFMGHAGLPSKEQWTVRVTLYQATMPPPKSLHETRPPPTADEVLVKRLRRKLEEYVGSLASTRGIAFDHGCWHEDPKPQVPLGGAEAGAQAEPDAGASTANHGGDGDAAADGGTARGKLASWCVRGSNTGPHGG